MTADEIRKFVVNSAHKMKPKPSWEDVENWVTGVLWLLRNGGSITEEQHKAVSADAPKLVDEIWKAKYWYPWMDEIIK